MRPRVRVAAGAAAWPVQLRFVLSVLAKRLLAPRRYPLLDLGGFLATVRLLGRVHMTSAIRVGKRTHFSLLEPRWPSRAYDHMIARGSLSLAAAGTPRKAQVDLAVLGVTSRCPYRCAHCYEARNLSPGERAGIDRWRAVIGELQDIGVGVIALSGGEPLHAFERTRELLACVDPWRSDVHLYTSGAGVTAEKVRALVDGGLAAVAVGLDHPDPGPHDALRQRGAHEEACRAIRLFADAGILVYANTCATRELVRGDGLPRLHALLRELGAGALQLLEPRACGGFAGGAPWDPADTEQLRRFAAAQHARRGRDVGPAVYLPAEIEAPGNLGCVGGGLSHLYVDSAGHLEPCVFLPVSFGNVLEEGFAAPYRRMREAMPRPLHRPCPAVELAARVGFTAERGPLPVPHPSIREEWAALSAPPATPSAGSRAPARP